MSDNVIAKHNNRTWKGAEYCNKRREARAVRKNRLSNGCRSRSWTREDEEREQKRAAIMSDWIKIRHAAAAIRYLYSRPSRGRGRRKSQRKPCNNRASQEKATFSRKDIMFNDGKKGRRNRQNYGEDRRAIRRGRTRIHISTFFTPFFLLSFVF